MKATIQEIKGRNRILVKSDKTNNYYYMTPDEYYTLVERERNKEYKKDEEMKTEEIINKNTLKMGESLGISDILEVIRKEECYLLLKDHMPSFYREKQARLINPIKNQLGIVSKTVLDRINSEARQKLGVNQFRATQEAQDWFDKSEKKKNCTLLKADIKDYYPSITEKVIKKCSGIHANQRHSDHE